MERVEIGAAVLYRGDCLSVLEDLPDGCVGGVITDPPFSSGARTDAGKSLRGGMLRGAKWEKDWFSHDNMATHGFLFLMRLLGVELLRVCKVGGNGHFFIDWRMYPNLYGALESSGWIVKNLVVWDKGHFGMGQNYRNQHELIIYAEKGGCTFPSSNTGNVIKDGRVKGENHPTEKPTQLIRKIIKASLEPSITVLDPFMGSGSTGVSAVQEGRKFLGIEIDPHHFETACRRIEEAQRQMRLFG